MLLDEFMKYDQISILCHDNPDADALASGYGLYTYFKHHKKNVQLIYSGDYKIQKTNLVKMIELLEIPITYYEKSKVDGLLITVDCQYGSGNVTSIEADAVAIIDHHQQETYSYPLTYISSYLGSCATIVWQLLTSAGFPFNRYPKVATALYYGLYTDTNQFSELFHPVDKDMKDALDADLSVIKRLKNSNLSLNEIVIAGQALIHYYYDEKHHYALVKSMPCDPNILGVISDMMLQVDCVNTCIVYNILSSGIKLSIRSCDKEVKASELAAYLTSEIGSGGGHLEKAGGLINPYLLHKKYGNASAENYLVNRLNDYFTSYTIIDARTYHLELSKMQVYQKSQSQVGYVAANELLPLGTPIIVHTPEGDLELCISNDFYLMTSAEGDIYPVSKENFHRHYLAYTKPFQPAGFHYFPSIKNKLTGGTLGIKSWIKSCVPNGEVKIYAKQLDESTKLFTLSSSNEYLLGEPGDYLVARYDNPDDIYIIKGEIFHRLYEHIAP